MTKKTKASESEPKKSPTHGMVDQGGSQLDAYLRERTGWTSKFWFDWIGERIYHHSWEVEDSVHREGDITAWMRDLIQFLHDTIQPLPIYDWTKMDGNIICASLAGLIFTLWSCRIIRCKSYDGRRRVEDRRRMMHSLNRLHHMLLECMVNESRDHVYAPAQGWDPPFPPGALNGDYV